jgi:hypothetical protein
MLKRITGLTAVVLVLLVGAMVAQADEVGAIRLDSNPAALANVYRVEGGFSVWRWNAVAEQGEFQFYLPYDRLDEVREMAMANDENILMEQKDDVSFWVLASGEYQVNSPIIDGPTYAFVFN